MIAIQLSEVLISIRAIRAIRGVIINDVHLPTTTLRGKAMVEIVCRDESYALLGACFEVHHVMGSGFLEAVYQECLEIEFADRGIPAIPRHQLRLSYKHHKLRSVYVPDFLCYGKIVLEIKGIGDLSDIHRAQVLNYLKATGCRLGLLINFGRQPKLQYERIVL